MDVVNVPTYDGFQAAATSLRMASRITGRRQAWCAAPSAPTSCPRSGTICQPDMEIELLGYDPRTGQLDLDALKAAISAETAAVYFENPSYLGIIETQGDAIARIAHEHGALCVVAPTPSRWAS